MKNIKEYINNPYQIAGTRHYTLDTGFSKGVSAIDVKTGSGLEYTVVKDRALDISLASFKGTNLTYIARRGEVAPSYYNREGLGWMDSFFGGLLTTCGPENIGRACTVGGVKYPQHGTFSNTPATDITDNSSIENGTDISGKISFGMLGGNRLEVTRHIKSAPFSSEITVEDTVTNTGNDDMNITMLYHTNYGYPLLSEDTEIFINRTKTEPYDGYSEADIENVFSVSRPLKENSEKNYFHYMPGNGENKAAVINRKAGIGVLIEASDTLPVITHCKIERPGDYFMAIEPCNTLCMGREDIAKRNMLPVIKSGETVIYSIKFTVISGEELNNF